MILEQQNIDVTDRRIICITDSLFNFCPLITPPNDIDKHMPYATLFRDTLHYIKSMKIVLWKVKSHTKPYCVIFNDYADILADEGQSHPNNGPRITPSINSLQYHSLTTTHDPNGVNLLNVIRLYEQRISMESNLPGD